MGVKGRMEGDLGQDALYAVSNLDLNKAVR